MLKVFRKLDENPMYVFVCVCVFMCVCVCVCRLTSLLQNNIKCRFVHWYGINRKFCRVWTNRGLFRGSLTTESVISSRVIQYGKNVLADLKRFCRKLQYCTCFAIMTSRWEGLRNTTDTRRVSSGWDLELDIPVCNFGALLLSELDQPRGLVVRVSDY